MPLLGVLHKSRVGDYACCRDGDYETVVGAHLEPLKFILNIVS